MGAETGFLIDNTVYEVPVLSSLTLDEAQVLYDYSGLTLEDFMGPDDDGEQDARFKNPGLLRALMHIAYQRAHADTRPAQVRALIGSTNFLSAIESALAGTGSAQDRELGDDDGDEEEVDGEAPPASTSEPQRPSASGTLENRRSPVLTIAPPGNGSANGSDALAADPAITTASRSGTSSTFAHPI